MVTPRRYSDHNPTADAATIADEVIRFGVSEGWQGSIGQRIDVRNILRPFNIIYVDDLRGSFEYRVPAERT